MIFICSYFVITDLALLRQKKKKGSNCAKAAQITEFGGHTKSPGVIPHFCAQIKASVMSLH